MKPTSLKTTFKPAAITLLAAAACALPIKGVSQSYLINDTTADAFLANGPTGNLAANNYGDAGTLAVAPASSPKGAADSVIMFNTASAVSSFNTEYGAGDWTITGLTLSLASNVGTSGGNPGNAIFNTISGGNFEIDWIADDSWVEGTGSPNTPSGTGVNYNSISTLLAQNDPLGTFTYTPPGNNIYASYALPLDGNLVGDAASGGNLSLYFYATNGAVSYLFNSHEYSSNHPELTITVTPTPEPATISLMAAALGGVVWVARRKKQ